MCEFQSSVSLTFTSYLAPIKLSTLEPWRTDSWKFILQKGHFFAKCQAIYTNIYIYIYIKKRWIYPQTHTQRHTDTKQNTVEGVSAILLLLLLEAAVAAAVVVLVVVLLWWWWWLSILTCLEPTIDCNICRFLVLSAATSSSSAASAVVVWSADISLAASASPDSVLYNHYYCYTCIYVYMMWQYSYSHKSVCLCEVYM